MSKLNKKHVSKTEETSHKNFMGGNSWDISDPFLKLKMIAASSFFGEPMYYNSNGLKNEYDSRYMKRDDHFDDSLKSLSINDILFNSESDLISEIEKIIDECLNTDIAKTLFIASELRNNDMIRTTPQVILVRASMNENSKGTGLVRKYAKEICKRADEPAACIAYLFSAYGNDVAIPNSLKKGLKEVLESFDEYSISKYKMEKNVVKTRDVVNIVHAYSNPIDKLMKGEAKQFNTWENIVSNASKELDKKDVWTNAAHNMPHMAMLRNLRNLIENDVDIKEYGEKLLNGVEHGKQLPFRYYKAYEAVNNIKDKSNLSRILDIIEQCIEKSIENVPHFKGNTICLSDNSGSACSALTSKLGTVRINEIDNLMSVITCMASDNGTVGIFGDKIEYVNITKTSSIIDLAERCNILQHYIGGSTENGIWLFFDNAIKKKVKYDNIFVYSDMQAGHGGLYGINHNEYKDYTVNGTYIDVPKLINKYRAEVNPNVMVYLVQTAGYKDILIPEYYDRTFIIGGWSQNILQFAKKMNEIYNEK